MQIQSNDTPKTLVEKSNYLVVEEVTKVYPTPNGSHTVLDGINLTVSEGEFICLIGHSGCGKSTLLNIVAGFNEATKGKVELNDRPIVKPGPDRMMVFQNYCLLPWKTAYDNVYLAVNRVYPDKSKQEKEAIVKENLAMVGLTEAAQKKPHQLSGGMKQRVAIARALAIRPQILIMDEPFGALDAITKEELQEELVKIWQEHKLTVLMITHDIDEALFLADRLVMMTNGPSAKIGEILDIPFARPRNRAKVIDDPRYQQLRNYALDFLFNRFAHDEDEEEEEETNNTRSLALKAVAALSVVTITAIAGLSLFNAMAGNKSTTPTPTTTESSI